MTACLVDLASGIRFALRKQRVVMGRRSDCDIVMARPLISAHHCVLQRNADGCWYVQDLDSTNGTWVNGEQVTESPLTPGDEFGLGKRLRFRFECED